MIPEIRQTVKTRKPYTTPQIVRVHVDPRQDLIAACDIGSECTPTPSS